MEECPGYVFCRKGHWQRLRQTDSEMLGVFLVRCCMGFRSEDGTKVIRKEDEKMILIDFSTVLTNDCVVVNSEKKKNGDLKNG